MSDQYPKRRVVKVREQDSGSYEFASLVWAMHILHYLSKSTIDGKGKPRGQPPLLMNEGAHHATGNTTKLGKDDSWENSKAKLLDCIAEAISSSRGWAMVTVTALRESETEVVIDVVTNAGWDYSGTDEEYHRLYTSNDRDFFDSVEEFISDIQNCKFDNVIRERFSRNVTGRVWLRMERWREELVEEFEKLRDDEMDRITTLLSSPALRCLEICLDKCLHETPRISEEEYRIHEEADLDCDAYWDVRDKIEQTKCRYRDFPDGYQDMELFRLSEQASFADSLGVLSALEDVIGEPRCRKIKNLLGSLCRPVNITSTLEEIGRRIPSGKRFRMIPQHTQSHCQLEEGLIKSFPDAWISLGLPLHPKFSGEITPETFSRLGGHDQDFEADCARPLPVHTELQLLRFYAVRKVWPTYDYFGCSKAACLLCETFLQLSPLGSRIRMRGRHGKCYSDWAIPSSLRLEIHRNAVVRLKNAIVDRIKEVLASDVTIFEEGVPDSPIISPSLPIWMSELMVAGLKVEDVMPEWMKC